MKKIFLGFWIVLFTVPLGIPASAEEITANYVDPVTGMEFVFLYGGVSGWEMSLVVERMMKSPSMRYVFLIFYK